MAIGTSSDDLFELVLADPRTAVEQLDGRLADPSGTWTERDRVRQRWARGTALRDLGRLDDAHEDLASAIAGALALGDRPLAGRIGVTASLVVLYRGDAAAALAVLDDVAIDVAPDERGHVSMQRALINHRMGRLDDAERGYRCALAEFESAADVLGTARACVNLGVLCGHRGSLEEGIDLLERAHACGQAHVAAVAAQNLGFLHARCGDVPAALDALAQAERGFAELQNTHQVALTRADRATVLMQANLLGEAQRDAEAAFEALHDGGHVADIADVALLAAQVRLANGDAAGARSAADHAATAFAAHGRDAMLVLSQFVELQADVADDRADLPSHVIARRAVELSVALARAGWTNESVAARLVAGRCLLVAGDVPGARRVLADPALGAAQRPAPERVAVHLARALVYEAEGDRTRARRAVSAGLATFATNQASLGALELRAHATALADDLALVGARLAVGDRRPRELLDRIEAARGAMSRLPQVRPPDDEELSNAMALLRAAVADLRDNVATGRATGAAERERNDLERRIADHARRRPASPDVERMTTTAAVRELAPSSLVEYGDLDGRLVAVTVVAGRAEMHELGRVSDLQDELDAVTFALHRVQRQQGSPASRRAAADGLATSGATLGRALLPARLLRSDAPVVVVPTGALHGLPWGCVPQLAGRAVTVAPSLTAHVLAARRRSARRPIGDADVALVAGPGLDRASNEIHRLASVRAGAVVVAADDATADRVAHVVGSSALVHFACHGTFRFDNPLFSALHVADGDITIYDLERCSRLPATTVISACNVAQSSVLRGGALLGLSSALLQLGVSSVIAPLTPVNDDRSVEVMVRVHTALAAGLAPAEALARAAIVDGELDTTAASFVCMGS